uniref:Uncharacterized protein n=1 Tax=Meloidogyne enterolobii TaxID=390850 RepID=A0A6V7WAQ6_MELEN|nr:unnamed protein product [Meloidogyne enterolobii]
MFYFIFILLIILINSSNSQFNWGTRSDHHTTGTILQANGGGVQRDDGHTQYYAHQTAYNNPNAWPRYQPFPNFGK